jgi:hypothetical protein
LDLLGTEKSSISLFMMSPVSGIISCDPNTRLRVLVRDTAIPDASAVETWDVPGLDIVSMVENSQSHRLTSQDSPTRLDYRPQLAASDHPGFSNGFLSRWQVPRVVFDSRPSQVQNLDLLAWHAEYH